MKQLPVKGEDAVEILINDHATIKDLVKRLPEAERLADRKRILERLIAALTVHNATEENLVYPALQEIVGEKRVSQHLYHETAEADVAIFQLDTMLKQGVDGKYKLAAEKIRDAVLEHIDEEEKKAFPRLQEEAEPEAMELLTQSVRKFRSELKYDAEA
jgi:hemerythrin superfamily protein